MVTNDSPLNGQCHVPARGARAWPGYGAGAATASAELTADTVLIGQSKTPPSRSHTLKADHHAAV